MNKTQSKIIESLLICTTSFWIVGMFLGVSGIIAGGMTLAAMMSWYDQQNVLRAVAKQLQRYRPVWWTVLPLPLIICGGLFIFQLMSARFDAPPVTPDEGGIGAAGNWTRNPALNSRGVPNEAAEKIKQILCHPAIKDPKRPLWSEEQMNGIGTILNACQVQAPTTDRFRAILRVGPAVRTGNGNFYDWLQAREAAEILGGFPVWDVDGKSSTPSTTSTSSPKPVSAILKEMSAELDRFTSEVIKIRQENRETFRDMRGKAEKINQLLDKIAPRLPHSSPSLPSTTSPTSDRVLERIEARMKSVDPQALKRLTDDDTRRVDQPRNQRW